MTPGEPLPLPVHGRGASDNPANRFERLHLAIDPDLPPEDRPTPQTQFFRDTSRTVLAINNSPDVPFRYGLNPYRGCEHGCSYCYARPYHEYLSMSAGLDFETRILVKEDAPELLRNELLAASWQGEHVSMSTVTDCYQPAERQFRLTRRCLEVFAEFRNPVGIITKNALVVRDAAILANLAEYSAAQVFISVTTLDPVLARAMEPRASTPAARLKAIETLHKAGVPVGVLVAPVIPGLTDHELPNILEACRHAGASFAGYVVLRLPHPVEAIFETWLQQNYPTSAERVMGRVREIHGGQAQDNRFGVRMIGEGVWATTFRQLFRLSRRKLGYPDELPALSSAHFRRPGPRQLSLFD